MKSLQTLETGKGKQINAVHIMKESTFIMQA